MWHLHYLQEKAGVYLSANGRLVGYDKAAKFSSERVALACLDLWLSRLHLRYGEDVRVEVEGHGSAKTDDSDAVTLIARARSSRFASNQSVPAEALEAAKLEVASWRIT